MYRALMLVAALVGLPAQAETLRLADNLPIGHVIAEAATKFWMSRVTELTRGVVTFQYFPSEQLGKARDMLQLTRSGVTDIGQITPSYTSDKMPLSAVAELPGGFATSCDGTRAFLQSSTNGMLARSEFATNGIHVLFAIVLPPYQLVTMRQQITTVASFSGLKIRIAGGAMDATVGKLGGTPIRLGVPDLYEAASRGTIDGMLIGYASLAPYDLAGLSKFATTGENFGSAATAWGIGEQRWKQLSTPVQAAMMQAGQEAAQHACAKFDGDVPNDIALLRGKGVTVQPLPPTVHEAVSAATSDVAREWAADLDRRGRPGTVMLTEFRSLVGSGH